MLLKKILYLSATLFLFIILCIGRASAQHGSLYFSVGYNRTSYEPTTIHVQQDELGNSYQMINVKGDSKTKSAISAYQLNYRIGFYCNYTQTLGLELNFDPVNYRIKDGQNVVIKGIINNTQNSTRTLDFSAKNGYYYYFNGANLLLLNLVERFTLFSTNSKNLRLDAIVKEGMGPVLPHFQNSMPIDPVNNPQLQYGGWNVGVEAGLRVTALRFFYFELMGKYDYANMNALSIYQGTAQQQLTTYELIGCVGLTIPTTRHNPLFWRQKIITIRPLYEQLEDSLDKEKEDAEAHFATGPMQDIPEFDEIIDKRTKAYNDSIKNVEDSLMLIQRNDSVRIADSLLKIDKAEKAVMDSLLNSTPKDTVIKADSTLNKGDQDNGKHKKKKKHKKDEAALVPAVLPDAGAAAPPVVAPDAAVAPPADAAPAAAPENTDKKETQDKKESKKDRKKREKEEKKAKEEKDKEDKAKEQPQPNESKDKTDNTNTEKKEN